MEWLTEWTIWHWLVTGFILLIAETLAPGVFLLWWGFAALIIAGVLKLIPDLAFSSQIISYAILAIVLSVIWWKYQHGKDKIDQSTTALNQRDHAMIGNVGKLCEMNENGIGRGAFGDTTWRVQGENLHVGDLVKVIRVQGITLQVEKVNGTE